MDREFEITVSWSGNPSSTYKVRALHPPGSDYKVLMIMTSDMLAEIVELHFWEPLEDIDRSNREVWQATFVLRENNLYTKEWESVVARAIVQHELTNPNSGYKPFEN